jgi:hypothetical protein
MNVKPHWLDEAFTDGKADPRAVAQKLSALPGFTRAVEQALEAYREAEKYQTEQPGLMAGPPAQMARLTFLEALSQETHG